MRAGLRDGCRAQIGREHLRTRMRPGMFCTTRSDRIGAKSKAERARRRSTRSVSRPGWTQAAVAWSRDTTRRPAAACKGRPADGLGSVTRRRGLHGPRRGPGDSEAGADARSRRRPPPGRVQSSTVPAFAARDEVTGEPRPISGESSDHVTACSEVRAKGCQRRFVVGDVEHTCASRGFTCASAVPGESSSEARPFRAANVLLDDLIRPQ